MCDLLDEALMTDQEVLRPLHRWKYDANPFDFVLEHHQQRMRPEATSV